METFEKFEQYLIEGLNHLYDPTYQPPELLWAVMGSHSEQGYSVEAVQGIIFEAIEQLDPGANVPQNARSKRFYDLLVYRYVQGLTQEKTAELLNLTTRHLRREQQQAIHVLAQHLWEQSQIEVPLAGDHADDKSEKSDIAEDAAENTPNSWHSQVKQELQSLEQSTPGVVNVETTIQGVVKVGSILASKHNVSLNVNIAQSQLMAAIHPSALRQILITAIEKLVQHMSSGEITLNAEHDQVENSIKITISGSPATADVLPHSDLIEEILKTQGGSVAVKAEGDLITFVINLLAGGKNVTVLVVDDNTDLVNFFRHYTARTQYEIVHLDTAQYLFDTIAKIKPGIIILDVMLPDVDGWELLTNLHEHHDTRSIPVIICSVVKRQELAAALGASLYLPKPVRRREFIQALDQVLSQGSSPVPQAEANNPATF
jgi:CheY-like chemotaxis protein